MAVDERPRLLIEQWLAAGPIGSDRARNPRGCREAVARLTGPTRKSKLYTQALRFLSCSDGDI